MKTPGNRWYLKPFQLLFLNLLFLAASLPAQTARYHFGDDLRWADPAFDDSSWPESKNNLWPVPPFRSDGYLWVRFRVPVPPDAGLQLAVSSSDRWGEEVAPDQIFVNGRLVGSHGRLPPQPVSTVWAPRVFPLPDGLAAPAATAVVAWRTWIPSYRRNASNPVSLSFETGRRDHLLLQESRDSLRDTVGGAAEFIFGLVFLLIGLELLVVSRAAGGSKDVFWFGILLIGQGLALHCAWVLPRLLPAQEPVTLVYLSSTAAGMVGMTGLLQFLPAALAFQRRWPFHLMNCYAVVISTARAGAFVASEPARWISAVLAAAAMFPVMILLVVTVGLRLFRTGRNSPTGTRPLAIALTAFAAAWAGVTFRLIPRTFFWGPIRLQPIEFLMLLLVAAVSVLLVTRARTTSKEREELEADLSAARSVQTALLPPPGVATFGEFQVETVYLPARQVGGDFYWFSPSPDGGLTVVAGDVSGKGLQAAMIVAALSGILGIEDSASPAQILATLNRGLMGRTSPTRLPGFVTCCCARFDVSGGVTLANAGHPSPYCDGREVEVEGGLPLGIAPEVEYVESVVHGKRFTFVSDGVVEAANAAGELFGFERTREISGKSAGEIAAAAQAWGQNDDITVVTLRRIASNDAGRVE